MAVEEVFDRFGQSDGYLAAGWTSSYGASGTDVWILRLDPWGEPLWAAVLGGPEADLGQAVRATPDGGFVVAAATRSFGAGFWDVWMLKFSESGSLEWDSTLGGPGDDVPNSVEFPAGGGCLLGATTDSFGAGGKDYWVFEFDPYGTLLWESTYGGAGDDSHYRLAKTSSGSFVLAGHTDSFPTPYGDTVGQNAWVLKLDAHGSVVWEKIYNKPFEASGAPIDAPDWAYNIVETSEGLYAVSGDTDWWDDDRSGDSWIFVVDPEGNLGCGIEFETDSLRLGGNPVTITKDNLSFCPFIELGRTSTPAVPDALESERFLHCPPSLIILPGEGPVLGSQKGDRQNQP